MGGTLPPAGAAGNGDEGHVETPQMATLEIRDLSLKAQGDWLLRGISLELEPGRIVGLRGASGSGKTTLLRALATLVDIEEGQLLLDGRSPDDWGYPAWRRHVSYLAQRPVLLSASVRANLERPFHYDTAEGTFDVAHAEALLDRVGFEPGFLERDASLLSEGEKQRVSFVRSMLVRPEVLLLDEPTSALDPDALGAVETVVSEFVAEVGGAALVATHDAEQQERFCDRVVDIKRWGSGAEERAHG